MQLIFLANPQQNLHRSLSLYLNAKRKTVNSVTFVMTEVRTLGAAKEGREPDTGELGTRSRGMSFKMFAAADSHDRPGSYLEKKESRM